MKFIISIEIHTKTLRNTMTTYLRRSGRELSADRDASCGLVVNPESIQSKYANSHDRIMSPCSQSIKNSNDIAFDTCTSEFDLRYDELSMGKGVITDRFIPTRRQLNSEVLFTDVSETAGNENTPNTLKDPSSLSLAEIYKKCIMNEPKNTIKIENCIENFHNSNVFKFNQSQRTSQPFLEKANFNFTDELVSSIKTKRKIGKLPYKVLDAPSIQDDFYLNLIDWSQQNFLAVGLASNVYLWNGDNSKVIKLCDLGLSDTVTSVGWSPKGNTFALGTNNGEVQIWDISKMKKTRVMQGHTNRIGVLSFNSDVLSTGSRDKTILHRDLRSSASFVGKLTGHKQEICGLKWSPDGQQLCSGGNDNKLMIWNSKSSSPVLKFSDHNAAVKAVAWSPHQHGLLASGGGTADRHIRFRNTLSGQTLKSIDTGSQVCNLIFSKTLNEIVSTHGYSFNEVNIWRYPKMDKVSTLLGHTMRVLYLTMSPDGSTIVTGAGDETLRFWNVFPSNKNTPCMRSQLASQTVLLR